MPSTPLAELSARALKVREALEASIPKPPAILSGLEGREHSLAVEAAAEFEPSIRDVFTAITAMSRTIVVRGEIKADITETLLPIYARLDSFDAGIAKLGDQTRNLNARVVRLESDAAQEGDRMSRIE